MTDKRSETTIRAAIAHMALKHMREGDMEAAKQLLGEEDWKALNDALASSLPSKKALKKFLARGAAA